MTHEERQERQQSLTAARHACELLAKPHVWGNTRDPTWRYIEQLIIGFKMLDAKEQMQREAGPKGAVHGSKGGRPKKKA